MWLVWTVVCLVAYGLFMLLILGFMSLAARADELRTRALEGGSHFGPRLLDSPSQPERPL